MDFFFFEKINLLLKAETFIMTNSIEIFLQPGLAYLSLLKQSYAKPCEVSLDIL